MDVSTTTAPRSDQLNFDDVAAHPVTVTVTEVKAGNPEQPVEVHLTEYPGRPFKPSKSMRRVLVAAWGSDSTVYVGRKMTLFGDPDVRFGGQQVGGIRISHLSHLTGPLTVALTVTRGKRAPFTVQPIPTKDESGRDWLKELADAKGDAAAIRALGTAAKNAFADPKIMGIIHSQFRQAQEGQA